MLQKLSADLQWSKETKATEKEVENQSKTRLLAAYLGAVKIRQFMPE